MIFSPPESWITRKRCEQCVCVSCRSADVHINTQGFHLVSPDQWVHVFISSFSSSSAALGQCKSVCVVKGGHKEEWDRRVRSETGGWGVSSLLCRLQIWAVSLPPSCGRVGTWPTPTPPFTKIKCVVVPSSVTCCQYFKQSIFLLSLIWIVWRVCFYNNQADI